MTDIQAYSATSSWPMACVNIDELLNTVSAEITAYEAKQLAKLKSELEAFHKKKDGVVQSYKDKYAALRERWCRQNSDVEMLYRHLTCLFKDTWKLHIEKCICPPRSEIAELEAAIAKWQVCCKGKLEAKRDTTKAEADAAKLYLDTIIANQAQVESALSANDKWIAQIKQILQTRDAAVSIHVFWFKLLPAHAAMAPADLLHCLDFAKGHTPVELCPPKKGDDGLYDAGQRGMPMPVPHPVPWLVAPDKYASEIDCAWTMYRDTKKAAGEADAAFLKAPDDIASVQKSLDALRKNLDVKIQDCLKGIQIMNDCDCGEASGERETQNPAPSDTNSNRAAEAAPFNAEV